MKNIIKLFAFFMIGYSTYIYAQATAGASLSVNIVTPISITKSDDMVFGNIASNGSTGSILIGTDGTRTSTGGVTLPTAGGSPKAASFVVSGAGNYTYSITLPSAPIMLNGITEGVTVSSFVSNPGSTGKLTTAGTQTIFIGAMLNVPTSVASGSYSNAAGLSVTVNYN
jgi:hypothetical protein